ncbi:MAG: outer membrane protein assembly factor BamE [Nitrospinales bacterium]
MRPVALVMIWFASMTMAAGCGSVGKNFDSSLVRQVENKKSTQSDIRRLYGEPFRTGIENGKTVWIYEFNTYSAVGEDTSKDLIFVFDKNGYVESHQSMSKRNSP